MRKPEQLQESLEKLKQVTPDPVTEGRIAYLQERISKEAMGTTT